jgi:RHS repeat-associated protein
VTNATRRAIPKTGSFALTREPAAVAGNAFNAANEMTAFNGTTLNYDADGNLTNDGTNSYTWDARNHLVGLNGSSTASFVYDGLGRRAQKTISGASTQFLYDALNPVREIQNGTPSANLLSGLGIDEYFQRTDSAGAHDYLSDILGSSIALTSTSGSIQTHYLYDPFGNTGTTGTSSSNPYQFTGRENDTPLLFLRGRYFSPVLDRFISEDPVGFSGGDSNLFEYVRSNPVNFVDPAGLATCFYSISDHSLFCLSSSGMDALFAQKGIKSGLGPCQNNPNSFCTHAKKVGPTPPDTYNISPNTLPKHEGWWALQSQGWIPGLSGFLCYTPFGRCGYNFHLGHFSEGCIRFDLDDPDAVESFEQLDLMLSWDPPGSTVTVY